MMDCRTLMMQKDGDEKRIQNIAKETVQFLLKHHIPLTPINYEIWFHTFCKAKEEQHVLTEKNLFVLYEKYLEEYRRNRETKKRDLEEISKHLERVTKESDSLLRTFDLNIDEHNDIIDESIDAIDRNDASKMEQLKKRVEKLEQENQKLKESLEQNRKQLEAIEAKFLEAKEAADIDPLTKVFNRQRLEQDIERFDKDCKTYSIIVLDIDNFKGINDTYGHSVGDRVLAEIGEILNNYLRKNTFAYRYGGEEFIVILPDLGIEIAKMLAKRLQEVIANRSIKIDRQFLTFSASFGVTQKKDGETFEDVFNRADEALYEAKHAGKNRVVLK